MSNRLLAALATVATLVLVSCGALSTPEFIKKAVLNDLYEIEAGKIASEKGQSEAVKEFGRQMVEAHTKTSEELKGIVEAEKLKVVLKLDPKHKKLIEALNDASPEDFDKTYAKQQVRAYKRAVGLFDEYAEEGDNAALKQFAANTLPTIKQQLEQAKKLPR